MSAGFVVIAIVALLLVVMPSLLLFRIGWRAGGLARIAAGTGAAALGLLAFVWLMPSRSGDSIEERAVVFLAAWGVMLVLGGSGALVVAAALRRRRAR